MKKEAITLKVSQETISKIEKLNLNLKEVVREAFLRGVSHLGRKKLSLSGTLKEKKLKAKKDKKEK